MYLFCAHYLTVRLGGSWYPYNPAANLLPTDTFSTQFGSATSRIVFGMETIPY
jgi:hypothetical protein